MIVTVWLIITLALASVAVLAIWSRARTRARSLTVLAFVLASPIAGASLMSSLGNPIRFVNGVTVPAGDLIILGAKMVVGEAIYVLLDRGLDAPVYAYMPWDPKLASELQKAIDESGPEGKTKMTVPPFEFSWDQHPPQFHAMPQPKVMPDKVEPEEPPVLGDQI